MILSTLCYIEQNGEYLMLHRTKKENDINKDKWLGVGGKFEEGESPEECIKREVKEETGLMIHNPKLHCVITYLSTTFETEYIYVFTSNDFSGELIECNEGDLKWIDKNDVLKINTWEGDKIFLQKIQNNDPFFTVKFEYHGENLIKYTIFQY